jgi:hypothetical protein
MSSPPMPLFPRPSIRSAGPAWPNPAPPCDAFHSTLNQQPSTVALSLFIRFSAFGFILPSAFSRPLSAFRISVFQLFSVSAVSGPWSVVSSQWTPISAFSFPLSAFPISSCPFLSPAPPCDAFHSTLNQQPSTVALSLFIRFSAFRFLHSSAFSFQHFSFSPGPPRRAQDQFQSPG